MAITIEMGTTSERGLQGGPALMDVEELLATRLLVQGNSGSGKSHLLRRLLEQSAPFVQQVIVDPEGDFVSLSDKFGHVVVDAARSENELETIAARVRQHRVSVVLNLESLEAEQQMKAAAVFLNALFDAERDHWFPALVVVDEAQLFAPAAGGEVAEEVRRASLGAMTNLMCRGRKRGLAGIIATQRLAKLAKNVAAEASNFLMGRTFLDIDMARAADLLGLDRRQAEMFRELQRGHFVALGPALSRKPLPIIVGPVETHARGSTPKLTPPPQAAMDDAKDLILAPVPVAARPQAERRPSPPPPPSVNEILSKIVSEKTASLDAEVAPPDPEANRDRELSLRRLAAEVLTEPGAYFHTDAQLYSDFSVRHRIRRLPGGVPPLPVARRLFNISRAGPEHDLVEEPRWSQAIELAASIPDEAQALFLCLARAALLGYPCPGDATLARVCGSRSTGRARSRLQLLEQRGLIVVRQDLRGKRSVNLPDIQCETAPGDAGAPDWSVIDADEARS